MATATASGCRRSLAAAIAATVAMRQRLILALAGEVALPRFVASRLHIDFRNAGRPAAYEAKALELAAAICHRPGGARPAPGGGVSSTALHR